MKSEKAGRRGPVRDTITENASDRTHKHHRHRRGGRSGRLFDYGELRFLLLAVIAEQPRHGYELIKLIEERVGGSYSPSPGVIYPTLSWLDDMGYASLEVQEGGRKLYHLTSEGQSFLAANQNAVAELLARISAVVSEGSEHLPDTVMRAMKNLKMAMRLRIGRGNIDEDAANKITAALDVAAQAVEKS
jgi:DNA-binding PadR family transcriptional regulator